MTLDCDYCRREISKGAPVYELRETTGYGTEDEVIDFTTFCSPECRYAYSDPSKEPESVS